MYAACYSNEYKRQCQLTVSARRLLIFGSLVTLAVHPECIEQRPQVFSRFA